MRFWIPPGHAIAALALIVACSATAQFLPPGVMNPGAGADGGDDVFVDQVFDAGGVLHAVWASQNDYTGSSDGDPDIFYARLDGTWSPAELVNSYGNTDGADDERHPRIAVGDGKVQVVWQSRSNLGGAGSDWDIFAAHRTANGWQNAEVVTVGSSWDDVFPNIAVRPGGDVLVVWEGKSNQMANDRDILYSLRAAAGTSWPAATPLNSNAFIDSGDDLGPVGLTVTADGDFVAAWSTDDDFRVFNPVGTDRDIVWSMLPAPPAGDWLDLVEVAASARGDSGADTLPAVAALGSGENLELHFAWTRFEDGDGDIHHTVVRGLNTFPPGNDSWMANSNGAADSALDTAPSLCFDSGGVLHLLWQSEDDLLTGPDTDIFHATNATPGDAWGDLGVLGLHGVFDGLADDLRPRAACGKNSVLSAMWDSNADLGGTIGSDFDILHAFGLGSLVTRPEPVNAQAVMDSASYDGWPSAAMDSKGALHVVWSHDTTSGTTDNDILHAELQSGSWSAPELVNINGNTDTGGDWSPSLAIDASDNLHVVWHSYENLNGTIGTDTDILYAKKSPAGWSAPELVNNFGISDSPPDNHDIDPSIAVESDGSVHVVWLGKYIGGPDVGSHIFYARRGPGGWDSPDIVNAAAVDGYSYGSHMILQGGTPHVVWATTSAYGGSGNDIDVFYSRLVAGSWIAPEFVNDAANDGAADRLPQIAGSPNGDLHVVWGSDLDPAGTGIDTDLFYARRTGGAWSSTKLLLASGQNDISYDGYPQIQIDGSATLHVVWAGDLDNLLYAAMPIDVPLPAAPPVLVVNGTIFGTSGTTYGNSTNPVLGRSGDVHFVWASSDTLGNTIGIDSDILYARTLTPDIFIFADGFE